MLFVQWNWKLGGPNRLSRANVESGPTLWRCQARALKIHFAIWPPSVTTSGTYVAYPETELLTFLSQSEHNKSDCLQYNKNFWKKCHLQHERLMLISAISFLKVQLKQKFSRRSLLDIGNDMPTNEKRVSILSRTAVPPGLIPYGCFSINLVDCFTQ